MWPWVSCVAVGKLYTAGELYAAGELCGSGEGKLCVGGVFGRSLASDPGVGADVTMAHRSNHAAARGSS